MTHYSEEHLRLMEEGFPIEDGFEILAKEVFVPYARIDILGKDVNGRLCIVELKATGNGRRGGAGYTTARRQLLDGGRGLNEILRLLGMKPVSFRYIYIRAHNSFGKKMLYFPESWENEKELEMTLTPEVTNREPPRRGKRPFGHS